MRAHYQAFDKAMGSGSEKAARASASAILAAVPEDRKVRQRFAKLLRDKQCEEEANALVVDGLPGRQKEKILRAVDEAGAALGADSWEFVLQGVSALCTIVHQNQRAPGSHSDGQRKTAVTKVLDMRTPGARKEVWFYAHARAASGELASASPNLLSVSSLRQTTVALLTLEYLDGGHPGYKDNAEVVKTWDRLRCAGSNQLRNELRLKHGGPAMALPMAWLWGRLNRTVPFELLMPHLHLPSASTLLWRGLLRSLGRRSDIPVVNVMTEEIRKTLWEDGLLSQLDPGKHYGVTHGDFTRANMIMERETGVVRVVDWSSVCWGPSVYDLMRFFTVNTSFADLRGVLSGEWLVYKQLDAVECKLLVTLICTWWLTRMSPEEIHASEQSHFWPAVQWLRAARQ
jgi:hypothetical protein